MVTVVMFHSALGLRPGVHHLADALRVGGHEVHTPDLYGGRTAADTEEGVRLRDEIGFTTLLARAEASLLDLPDELVFVGLSMGAAPAQLFGATRPGARGVVCLHGALAPQDLGLSGWPPVPVQVHVTPDDPWVDDAGVAALLTSAGVDEDGSVARGGAAVHHYPGTGHLFTDPDLPDHDADAAAAATSRVLGFLDALDA